MKRIPKSALQSPPPAPLRISSVITNNNNNPMDSSTAHLPITTSIDYHHHNERMNEYNNTQHINNYNNNKNDIHVGEDDDDDDVVGTADVDDDDPATLERRQPHRISWLNMRRRIGGGIGVGVSNDSDVDPLQHQHHHHHETHVTPSPQTLRSYVTAGTGSGRTTATSGRMSSSGVATISGCGSSSNTLNDIINPNDYHINSSQNDAKTITRGMTNSDDYHHHHQKQQQQHLHHHQHRNQNHNQHRQHQISRNHNNHQHLNHTFAGSSSSNGGTPLKNYLSNSSFNTTANGSTVKLLPQTDDNANQQTKCSVFRGLLLCICLNVSYANILRFPRELDKYGSAYLIPYVTLLFLVGLPVLLLEIALGQFLGQGAAHTWRASPIFKGACIIGRFASWLSTVWVSLQAVLALGYIAMFLFNTMPFRECVGSIKLARDGYTGYTVTGNSGQECLIKTFLTPFWENPFFYGVLSIGLICMWIAIMLCTHNSRILRRSLFIFGLLGFILLCTLTGWEVRMSFERCYFPKLWDFEPFLLYESHIWFNALMQVLFATNCGFGALPMLTGKFLYKGDAVRTSIVFLCFNLLINAIAVTLFMTQFEQSANSAALIEELKPLTAIYDRVLFDKPSIGGVIGGGGGDSGGNEILLKLVPIAIYALIVFSAFIAIIVSIYTATRLVPRHPNYFICLMALVMAIIAFAAPRFIIARILDSRIVGTMIVTALIFDLIAVTWIYGAKNVYTDLEFSIGRPIFKLWMYLWYICPAILTGLLVWWCSDDDEYDLLAEYVPRWAPILFVLAIICIIACIQIFRQVEYNFFGMICEASKPAKEWGPADPLARHAWKQWRSVCQDTGRRDFTLRRRGTRDYTHSIKNTAKYANGHVAGHANASNGQQQQQLQHSQHQHHQQQQQQHWKTATPGNSSPNYSGSMFGDSAIEEDISVDKFPGITTTATTTATHTQQFVPFHHQQQQQIQANNNKSNGNSNEINIGSDNNKHLSYSQRAGGQQQAVPQQPPMTTPQSQLHHHQSTKIIYHHQSQERLNAAVAPPPATIETHREVVYIRRLSGDNGQQHATRIEITPSNECITYGGGGDGTRNPMARMRRRSGLRSLRSLDLLPLSKSGPPLPPPIRSRDVARPPLPRPPILRSGPSRSN